MLKTLPTLKGYVAGLIAFIACPCHLPITLPLLISLTAGTALSAWLASHTLLAVVISTLVFIGSLVLAFQWLNPPYCPPTSHSANRRIPHAQSQNETRH